MPNPPNVGPHRSAQASSNHTERDAKPVHSTAEHMCCETRNQNLRAIQEWMRFCLHLFESKAGDADSLLLLGQCVP
jgi:hypothetical protein